MTHARFTAFALAAAFAAPAFAQNTMDFDIESGQVTLEETFAAKVEVLGAAITSSGHDVPVTVQVKIGDQTFQPFGAFNGPATGGNVNDGQARSFVINQIFDADAPLTIAAKSWDSDNLANGIANLNNSDLSLHYSRDSHEQSDHVKVLRHGDPVPNIAGFDGQTDAAAYIDQHIDSVTNTISLRPNQVIYLYELGVSDLDSAAADFQDLVVVVTLGKTPEELSLPFVPEALYD